MNQTAYFESLLLLPNALSLILPREGPGGSDSATCSAAYGAASRRPLVCLGLREHIYTGGLSTPSHFMAQQEQLFGTMCGAPLRAASPRAAAAATPCPHPRPRPPRADTPPPPTGGSG